MDQEFTDLLHKLFLASIDLEEKVIERYEVDFVVLVKESSLKDETKKAILPLLETLIIESKHHDELLKGLANAK